MSNIIIDTHPHIVAADTERYPITPIGGERSEWSKKRSVTFEQLVEEMDEAGVAKAAIVHSSTTYGFNNQYVVDSIARNPVRFTGVFSVDVTAPDAPERMRHWQASGMGGMRIFVRGSTIKGAWMTIDAPAAEAAWRTAAELGISVAVNTVCRGDGVRQVARVAEQHPQVNILVDHLGTPDLSDGAPFRLADDFFALSRFSNVHMKLTPHSLAEPQVAASEADSFLRRTIDSFGPDHIVWGSNFPSTKGKLVEIVARLRETLAFLSSTDRDLILSGTAGRLYPSLKV